MVNGAAYPGNLFLSGLVGMSDAFGEYLRSQASPMPSSRVPSVPRWHRGFRAWAGQRHYSLTIIWRRRLGVYEKGRALLITHYLGVSLTGRAFRSNLFLDKKGFLLQSLTRVAFEAYAKRQNALAPSVSAARCPARFLSMLRL